jgi:3-oxoacyl-[acyl-carrier-protein] synthase II
MTASHDRDAVITGIGLVTSIAEGGAANRDALAAGAHPRIDEAATPPFPVHPLVAIDLDKQIPRKGDQRQMEPWQRLGTYAAGLALADAGVAGNPALLETMHMIVAAGGGERDIAVDEAIMTGLRDAPEKGAYLNERLSSDLRPTLFLAQLSNLLAGNISIVHGVTGSSRTFMGEEAAGADTLRTVVARIGAGQADLGLVGAAYSAPRADMQLTFAVGASCLAGPYRTVWDRADHGGGMIPGSAGAFLVVESRAHAQARGARIIAKIGAVASDRTGAAPGSVRAALDRLWAGLRPGLHPTPVTIMSGATGCEPPTREERGFLDAAVSERETIIRTPGSLLGHAVEAAPIVNVALAALAIEAGTIYPPFDPKDSPAAPAVAAPEQIVVTSVGHWRGACLILVERA